MWCISVQGFPKTALYWTPDADENSDLDDTSNDNSNNLNLFNKVFGCIVDYSLNSSKIRFESTTIQHEALAVCTPEMRLTIFFKIFGCRQFRG